MSHQTYTTIHYEIQVWDNKLVGYKSIYSSVNKGMEEFYNKLKKNKDFVKSRLVRITSIKVTEVLDKQDKE